MNFLRKLFGVRKGVLFVNAELMDIEDVRKRVGDRFDVIAVQHAPLMDAAVMQLR